MSDLEQDAYEIEEMIQYDASYSEIIDWLKKRDARAQHNHDSGDAVAWYTCDAKGKEDLFLKKPAISDEDMNEYEIELRPLFFKNINEIDALDIGNPVAFESCGPDESSLVYKKEDAEILAEKYYGEVRPLFYENQLLTSKKYLGAVKDPWIPCSSRFPKIASSVMVIVDYDHKSVKRSILIASWTGKAFNVGPNSLNVNCGLPVVTHWMPLPSAPNCNVSEKQ